jgi:hypothetical protein
VPGRPPVAITAVVLLAAACSGSSKPASGPVAVTPASPAATGDSCAALVRLLPQKLQGAERRTATPDPGTTAAWGEPPITLVCGGPSGSPRDETFAVDGVRFAIHDVGAANTWTTLDRTPAVTVTVPDRYENQAELVGYLVGPLNETG